MSRVLNDNDLVACTIDNQQLRSRCIDSESLNVNDQASFKNRTGWKLVNVARLHRVSWIKQEDVAVLTQQQAPLSIDCGAAGKKVAELKIKPGNRLTSL